VVLAGSVAKAFHVAPSSSLQPDWANCAPLPTAPSSQRASMVGVCLQPSRPQEGEMPPIIGLTIDG
jgi:hypothetical protein